MKRTSWVHDRLFTVEARYGVAGVASSPAFPYVNNLSSIRDAIEIAKTYQGNNTSQGSGRIYRELMLHVPGSRGGISFRTHEWYVHANGTIQRASSRPPGAKLPTGVMMAQHLEQEAKRSERLAAARTQSLDSFSPAAYEAFASQIISMVLRGGRLYGFPTVYAGHPDHQEEAANVFARHLNDHLAEMGFRTLPTDIMASSLSDAMTAQQALRCDVFGSASFDAHSEPVTDRPFKPDPPPEEPCGVTPGAVTGGRPNRPIQRLIRRLRRLSGRFRE